MPKTPTSRFRLDSVVSKALMRYATGHAAAPARQAIPILMYHSVSETNEAEVHPYYRTCTSPATFERHMQLLRADGYKVISLADALDILAAPGKAVTDRTVVLTFDDGFRDFYTHAFPVIQRFGFHSTVFLATGCLDGNFVSGPACLSRSEVRDLARSGVQFGSHTVTHRKLITLTETDIADELGRSKSEIEDLTDRPVKHFSFPYAFPEEDHKFTDRLRSMVQDAGYSGGVTTMIGRATSGDDPIFLKRLPANSNDDDALLRAKLSGAYDWLHRAQSVTKQVRRIIRTVTRQHSSEGMKA